MNKTETIKALETVINAVDKKESPLLVGTDSFIFGDGYVYTTNMGMAFSHPIDTDIECTVKAHETLKVLKKFKGEDLQFSLKKGALEATDGKSKLKMKLIDEDAQIRETISSLGLDNLDWNPFPEDFLEGIRLCSFAMTRDGNRQPKIFGIAVEDRYVWATDESRISRFEMSGEMPRIQIPFKAVLTIVKLTHPPTEYALDNGRIYLKSDSGVIFITAELDTDFPVDGLSEIIGSYDTEEDKYVFPEGLERSIELAEVMSAEDKELALPCITISRKGKHLIVKGEKECGSVEDKIEFSGDMFKDGLSITIPPEFLKIVLGTTRDFYVSEDGVVIFRTNNFTHLMVVNINGKEEG